MCYLPYIALLLLLAVSCSSSRHQSSALPVCYQNAKYDLRFLLPAAWRGHSVLLEQWEGRTYSEATRGEAVTARGLLIILRHPEWTPKAPCQDIPIMVFTRTQWAADKQGQFTIGAGGFDMELWHNEKYVFALSSRYNAADNVKGWKEVGEIVEQNRAAHNMPRLYPE